jgi:thiamine transporter ThiT
MDMLTLFVLLAALATVISLVTGITSMAQGGEADAKRSHRLMFQRVGWQALTVFFLLLGLLSQIK